MSAEHPSSLPPSPAPSSPAPAAPVAGSNVTDNRRQRVWQSAALLGDASEVIIEHRGQTYRLRCTKQGKLILYK